MNKVTIERSQRLDGIGEYYFSRKLREISEIEAATGRQIIRLAMGSPDLPPHQSVIDRLAKEAQRPDVHKYMSYQGEPILRKAFADWYKRYYNVDVDFRSEVLPLLGSKEGLMHICQTFLNVGDKVIIANKKAESSTVRVMMTTMYDSSKIKLSSDYTTITSNIEIAETALPENTAVFTVEEGATAGTFAFKAEGVGYLNGGYDDENWSSFLNYSSTLEAGASWTVELISNGAKMSSCYNGSSTRFLNNYDNYKMNYANSRSTSYHYYIFYIDGEAQGEPEQPEQRMLRYPG